MFEILCMGRKKMLIIFQWMMVIFNILLKILMILKMLMISIEVVEDIQYFVENIDDIKNVEDI